MKTVFDYLNHDQAGFLQLALSDKAVENPLYEGAFLELFKQACCYRPSSKIIPNAIGFIVTHGLENPVIVDDLKDTGAIDILSKARRKGLIDSLTGLYWIHPESFLLVALFLELEFIDAALLDAVHVFAHKIINQNFLGE